MEKVIDKTTGFTFKRTNDKIIIEMPISNLVRGLETDPNNCWDGNPRVKIIRGMRNEFAEWVFGNLQDDCDEDDNETFVTKMLSNVYTRIYDGYEDFASYGDEDD